MTEKLPDTCSCPPRRHDIWVALGFALPLSLALWLIVCYVGYIIFSQVF